MDNYSPIPLLMSLAQDFLARYETWAIFQPLKIHLRAYGLKFCREYMAAEDLQTNYIDIGPVNKVLNFLSAYHGELTSCCRCRLVVTLMSSFFFRLANILLNTCSRRRGLDSSDSRQSHDESTGLSLDSRGWYENARLQR
jgi:hypothetical protein